MTHGAELIATEYGKVGLEFAQSLASGCYEVAHTMLTAELKQKWPAERIKQTFERMIQHGAVTRIEAMEGYDDYPDQQSGDIGGVYVSISGHDPREPLFTYNEAVMVHVRREREGPRIRKIIWGRP